mmetsp:Transcript_1708/g.1858  ORF Transcript_1708/g.1858 Transcript_1708/m.1858 type:complete len:80 (+) Transcript_1708:34-273(+)
MEPVDVLTALIKEFGSEKRGFMAIYFENIRISRKGREYLLEKKDDNNHYQLITVLKDKDAVIIFLRGKADLSSISILYK